MNNDEYQKLPGVSSHQLIAMLESPANCWRKYIDPQRPQQETTASLTFGTLIHCLALNPHTFDDEFLVADYEQRSKAGKERYAQLKQYGLKVIKPEEHDRARAIVTKLQCNPESRALLRHGKKERTIIQPRQSGLLPLKARLDVHNEAKRQVIELKTTWNIAQAEATMERYRYPLSAAFYQDISRANSVILIFVETCEPFEIVVFEMAGAQLQAGREQFQTALNRFDQCWTFNQWPEAEPAPADTDLDHDPLLMNVMPGHSNRYRFELPVGELAL
ncbi:MAG: PD-(D/E)XK nuclease-like domain-containing protein [Candidatus Competibacteraceae bacterium]|nr:PD-(D/E)XK nuclease-like domain-containing protein [Candidatus Competibacteraceae bacterium]